MILKEQLNHYFYSMTVNELQLMNEKFKSLNITYNSLLYLDMISHIPDCTVTYLAQALCISKSAVTLKVNDLVKQGLLTKEPSRTDKRSFYLRMNDDIASIYNQYSSSMQRAIQQVNETYSAEELDAFCHILQDITKIYTEEILHEK